MFVCTWVGTTNTKGLQGNQDHPFSNPTSGAKSISEIYSYLKYLFYSTDGKQR
jgi:hypothetical protein